ncbi:SymE family type I addiction module toxin [Serratia microhaemolytica]|uniref:SymE family type I addiction module toxin n=1 Tax=Serratia microhaemolytica TaxID=2675110 RepID=UPI000FDE262B|nr:SymE family type I addiction module toxin [Serratia microhaemolytica]
MNTLKYNHGQLGNGIPVLSIEGDNIAKAGFTSNAVYVIDKLDTALMLTLLEDEQDIKTVICHCRNNHNQDIALDSVAESGELYLAGEWLIETGLAGQPLDIFVTQGKVIVERL